MRRLESLTRCPRTARILVTTLALLLAGGVAARAQTEAVVSIQGGAGAPGGAVDVETILSDASDAGAVSARVQIEFPPDDFEADFDECILAPRLADTHILGGASGPNFVLLDVRSQLGASNELSDGNLATCPLRIRMGVPAGTVALTFSNLTPSLLDSNGTLIPVSGEEGTIVVLQARTPTVTPSRAPGEPTPTPRDTRAPTRTGTPTRTAGPTFTVRTADGPDGCSMLPPAETRPLSVVFWLVGVGLLFRRRRKK